jgi:uncharacterized cupredoxin-like copper-binding protein/Spy/CpxP family protein refolding chaperone
VTIIEESTMKTKKIALVAAALLAGSAWAQHHGGHDSHGASAAPYAGLQSREIKALSTEDARSLLEGQGMQLALAAELNGYPGPAHVLEHADALQLTPEQRAATQALMHRHQAEARQLGAALVEAERQLDRAFAGKSVSEPELARLTGRIGTLQGQLRAAHLRTHLQQTALLTPQQVAAYQQLRGYTPVHTGPAAGKHGAVSREQKPWGIAGDAKGSRTIEIRMSDDMRFRPDRIEVREGETIRFVVRNAGKVLHEMVIGTEKELQEHAALMRNFPGMEHDEPFMTHVKPGRKGDIVWNFNRPGTFQFACLIPGHYEAGMKGTIIVTPRGKKS